MKRQGTTPPSPHGPPRPNKEESGKDWLRRTGTRTVEKLHRLVGEISRPIDFKALVDKENARLDHGRPGCGNPATPMIAKAGISGEPWIRFTDRDRVGLALSGGGIRSATFNLGLLQALEHKSLLKEVDYLSTVSGGGYIGGFWTAWLQRRTTAEVPATRFPESHLLERPRVGEPDAGRDSFNVPEAPSVRHLREFSRFLMPRLGFFQSETWDGIVAILGGLLPALLAATALVALGYYVWFLAARTMMAGPVAYGAVAVGLLTFAIHIFAEHGWHSSGKRGRNEESFYGYLVLAAVASALAAIGWRLIASGEVDAVKAGLCNLARADKGGPSETGEFSWTPFALSAVWALVAVLLLFGRAGCAAFGAAPSAEDLSRKLERAASRFFAPAMIWAAFALVWEIGLWVRRYFDHSQYATSGTGAVAAACCALFIWLRDWLGKPPQETNATQLLKRAVAVLKPVVPEILADIAVVLLFLVVCLLLQGFGFEPSSLRYGIGGALLVLAVTLFFFNPARVGLHEFYRSRICRCYLGAAGARNYPDYSRPTVEQPGDDFLLGDLLANDNLRPIHLICCTANNLSGDPLGSLYRGGRSAAVSPFGLSLGDSSAPMNHLRLSSVLTASAAAFNSQMGSISMRLGPAVSFLMCAFNLRLGLWVPHPRNPLKERIPHGLPFFYEMFGRTRCDPTPSHRIEIKVAPRQGVQSENSLTDQTITLVRETGDSAKMLHLSDGGHFENLAVYELVRRHCRYIIASDSGADPQLIFDDLANALRRIREDFGIEIELDVNPLRPGADGFARQHAVVGTIHYDGFAGTDKGTIIYLKPLLTGDEPPDVLEYRQRSGSFPHETTGDQFYDEPQWESYRRLGEHAGNVIFQYVEELPLHRRADLRFVENVFLDATDRWFPVPDRQSDAFVALNERCIALDAAVRDTAPPALRAEFFPEVGAIGGQGGRQPGSPHDEMRVVFFLMEAAQLMEDVWKAAELATQWSHPVNEAWMSYFQRWASTPSFRHWWPLLRPIYSVGFRNFVRDRFCIVVKDSHARAEPAITGAELTLTAMAITDPGLQGLAWQQWVARWGTPDLKGFEADGYHAFDYAISLAPGGDGDRGRSAQVGFVLYRQVRCDGGVCVEWNSQNLFVPYPLIGAGIVARLLDATINHFTNLVVDRPRQLRVFVDEMRACAPASATQKQFSDPGSRLQRVRDISFYRSRGFSYVCPDSPGEVPNSMILLLPRTSKP